MHGLLGVGRSRGNTAKSLLEASMEVIETGSAVSCYRLDSLRSTINSKILLPDRGAQWLCGRVLDPRQRGRGFDPHLHHCVVVLEKDTFILA